MRLSFERSLDAPPEAIFRLIADPSQMSRWSTARVEALSPGDGGLPWGIGAMRAVHIPLPAAGAKRVREVVRFSAPPYRLDYRVVDGFPLRLHEGTMRLLPSGSGSRLSWDVDIDMAVPGLASAVGLALRPEIERSLDALGQVARGASPEPCQGHQELDESAEVDELRAQSERVLVAQRALLSRLERAGDPKRWFAHAYSLVTEGLLAHSDSGRVLHPAWLLRLVPAFHELYARNLEAWALGRRDEVEAHWVRAFTAMERPVSALRPPTHALLSGLLAGVAAHIEDDLPRALAIVHHRHYAGRCDYARFRADYLSLSPVFGEASDRLAEALPRERVPSYLRWARAAVPFELADELRHWRFYDIPRRREQSFARGGQIAQMMLEAEKSPAPARAARRAEAADAAVAQGAAE